MNIIFDTNIWVALFNQDDSSHSRARVFFETIANDQTIVLPEQVLVEVVTVLTRKSGKAFADRFVREVRNNLDVEFIFSDALFLSNTLDYFLAHVAAKLSFVDISLLMLAKTFQVVTFDQTLNRAIEKI